MTKQILGSYTQTLSQKSSNDVTLDLDNVRAINNKLAEDGTHPTAQMAAMADAGKFGAKHPDRKYGIKNDIHGAVATIIVGIMTDQQILDPQSTLALAIINAGEGALRTALNGLIPEGQRNAAKREIDGIVSNTSQAIEGYVILALQEKNKDTSPPRG